MCHPEVFEKYKEEIEYHENKTPIVGKIAVVSIDKLSTHTLDSKVYPSPKRRRMLQPSNDEGIFSVPIEAEYTDTYRSYTTIKCVPIDKIREWPIVKIDTSKLFESNGPEHGQNFDRQQLKVESVRQNCDRQQLRVEMVREDTNPDEFVKEKPEFCDEHGSGVYGNDVSNIEFERNADGDKFIAKEGATAQMIETNATETELSANFKKVLFSNYYRIIEKTGNKLAAECKNCKSIVRDGALKCSYTRRHMRVCINNNISYKILCIHL